MTQLRVIIRVNKLIDIRVIVDPEWSSASMNQLSGSRWPGCFFRVYINFIVSIFTILQFHPLSGQKGNVTSRPSLDLCAPVAHPILTYTSKRFVTSSVTRGMSWMAHEPWLAARTVSFPPECRSAEVGISKSLQSGTTLLASRSWR